MAIVHVDPPEMGAANAVQVDSDAADNMAAIREIDAWAAANSFERVNESWLRQRRLPAGTRVFRGVCIRLTEDELAARDEENRRVADRMARMRPQRHAIPG